MNKMQRKEYVSSTMLRSFLWSVAVSILAGQVPILLKPVIAGNFLGGEAIAAIALTSPILELCYVAVILLVVGPSYIATEYISVHETQKAKIHFTVSGISTLVVLSLMSVTLFYFNDSISFILSGGQAELTSLVKEYLPSVSCLFIPVGLFNFFAYYFQAEGQIRITVRCSILVSTIDVTLTIVLLSVFNLGIVGISLALMISTLIGVIFFILKMKSESVFRFVNVSGEFLRYFKINFRKGLPLMADQLLSIAFFLLCNLIIVNVCYDNGPVIWGVATTFITISTIILSIVSESMLTLGQEMLSTKDYYGCKHIIKKHRIVDFMSVVFCLAFVELFPHTVMELFGETDISDNLSLTNLRLAVSVMLVMSVVLFEATNYYLLGKSRKYYVSITIFYLIPVLVLLIFATINPELTWWALLVGTGICLIGAGFVKKDTDKYLDGLHVNNVSMDMSVSYQFSDIKFAIESIKQFLSNNDTGGTIDAMEHSVEELLYNIIKHAPERLSDKSFDLRAIKLDNDVIVFFKYDGKPFNPIIEFSDTAVDAMVQGLKPQLALRIFNHYAISPWYHYGYGVNTLSMTVPCHQ